MHFSRSSSVLSLSAIFLALYFFEIASFPLSIDEELVAIRPYGQLWISQGRWGAFLVEWLLVPQPTVPFLAPALFGACCIGAYLLILDAINATDSRLKLADLAGFALFCGYPTWFFIMEFYSNMPAVGLGLLCAAGSTWLHFADARPFGARVRIAASIALAAFAIATYQSYLFCIAAMGCGVWFLRLRRAGEPEWKRLWSFAAIVAAACLAYGAIDRTFLAISGAERIYVQNFVNPGRLLSQPLHVVGLTGRNVLGVYGFSEYAYLRPLWAAPLVLAAGSVAVAVAMRDPARRVTAVAAAVPFAALLAPFAMNLVSGGSMPYRSLVGAPFVMWLFAHLALTARERWLVVGAGVAVAGLVFQSVALGSAYQAANVMVARHDQITAAAIRDRIANADGFDPKAKYALVVYGGLTFATVYPRPETSTVGRSFFEWDGGNAYRIAIYMNLLGFDEFYQPSGPQQERVVRRLAGMPLWPAPGSVAIDGNVAIVRLGEQPNRHNVLAMERLKAAGK